jgi:regulator of cell morphogenesis and NO signaling
MQTETTGITPETTVNEAAARFPATLRIFSAHGIDSCCGGAKPLAEVAQRHGLELDDLLDQLREVAGA